MSDQERRESDPRAAELLARYTAAFGAHEGAVPVDNIATDLLGLRVVQAEQLGVSGLLVPGSRYVYLDAREARDSEGRRRFTLAHEIGHWVCQCDEGVSAPPEPILCRPADMAAGPDASLEHEANNFAASLLMPEAAIRAAAADGMDCGEAASWFSVSEIAMEWRYFNLRITDARPQRAEPAHRPSERG